MLKRLAAVGIGLMLAAVSPGVSAKEAETADPARVWDLTQLYPDAAAWAAEQQALAAQIPALRSLSEGFVQDAPHLLAAMDQISAVNRRLLRLNVYAGLKADEDTRNSTDQARRQSVQKLNADIAEATSFVGPKITALGNERLQELLKAEPKVAVHRFALEDLARKSEHTLGEEAESVLAASSVVTAGPKDIYNLMANSDMPWPQVKRADGQTITVDQQGYVTNRDATDRVTRQRVFDAFWRRWGDYKNVLGAMMAAHIQGTGFTAKARHYPNAVASALDDTNVPEAVYRTLVRETNAGLPTLHRYFALRKRLLGLSEMRYYDVYVPLAKPPRKFTLDQAKQLTLEAVEPLGADYQRELRAGFDGRWLHALVQPGKASGAYMSGSAYDVHPYVLLSYADDYESMSTLAHEFGHAMHTVLANRAQPFELADYPIFTAEIASTLNEMLLADHMIATAHNKSEKLFYLSQAMELLRATFFRQAMFAEFELATHDAAQRGEPLTGDAFEAIYLDLLKRYHGDAEGVVKIDDSYGMEWAYIPHFYRDFYVYKYATSIAAAAYFEAAIKSEGEPARVRYLGVLQAGGSAYPYDILNRAGLDMASAEPYRALIRRMDDLIDQSEALTAKPL